MRGRFVCLALSVFFLSPCAYSYDTAYFEEIAAGGWHTCALIDGQVHCWGENHDGQTQVPSLFHPTQVCAGDAHTCALDDKGVHCWGWNRYGQTDVPTLTHPTAIACGSAHSCAIDGGGVTCWGRDRDGDDPPKWVHPKQVAAGKRHTCVLDDEGVKCWGDNDRGQLEVPPLAHPRFVSAGADFTCALDEQGLKCWGDDRFRELHYPPAWKPIRVSTGIAHGCVTDLSGMRCWGDNRFDQSVLRPLLNPTSLSAGGYHTCALDDEGVKCWGSNRYGQTGVPKELASTVFSFHLPTLERTLRRLALYSYSYRGKFFQKLSSVLAKHPFGIETDPPTRSGLSWLFALNALEPVLKDSDSVFFREHIWESYEKARSEWNGKFGIRALSEIELNEDVYTMCLELVRGALEACRDFVGEASPRAELEEEIVLTGKSQAKMTPVALERGQVTAWVGAMQKHEALLERLSEEKRTRGFGILIRRVLEYLGHR